MSDRIQCCIKLYTKLEKEQEKEKISGKEKQNPYLSWCQSNDKEAEQMSDCELITSEQTALLSLARVHLGGQP